MPVIVPDEAELRLRLVAHLQRRPGNPLVPAVWHGYLAGLLEWGVIDGNAHGRLSELLPNPGAVEMIEIMAGLDYVEAHPEMRIQSKSEHEGLQGQPVNVHAG